MLNMELALDMNVGDSEEVSVEICLIHNNMEYTITRTQEYTYQAKGVRPGPLGLPVITFRQTDGQTKRIRDTYVNKTINEILPQELSSYFFFDAERIGSITSKSDVTDSVKGLLGLSILQNAMNHLKGTSRNNVIAKFKASMDPKATERRHKLLPGSRVCRKISTLSMNN